jgi:probable HAF family extracellular repeat protein
MAGAYSFAYGINNAAQVVGQSQANRGEHAFITGPDGVGMRDLGGGSNVAYDINDSGQAVGFSFTHVFITGPDGVGMTAIEPLDDRSPSISLEHQASPSINNSGAGHWVLPCIRI